MKRSQPLRRVALRQSGALNAQSRRRKAEAPARAKIRAKVLERDGGCVLRALDPGHRCFGPLEAHHVLKASAGGSYTEANLVTLCRLANGWVEDQPAKALALGLVERRGA